MTLDPTTERARPGARRRALPPLGAAASVVAIGLGAAIWAGHRSDSPTGSGPHVGTTGGLALTGTHWNLVSVRTGTHTVRIRASLHAFAAFGRGGEFQANDGVNGYDGKYRTTGDDVVLSNPANTAVGYVGSDPGVLAAVRGFSDLSGTVPAVVAAGRLTLRAGGATLTFTSG